MGLGLIVNVIGIPPLTHPFALDINRLPLTAPTGEELPILNATGKFVRGILDIPDGGVVHVIENAFGLLVGVPFTTTLVVP